MTKLPLEGIRVVESTYVFAFPYAAGLLADMGAEVIKVEGAGHVDVTRGGAFAGSYPDNVPGGDPWNRPGSYNQLNRGKKSLVLDLSQDAGREVLVDLLRVTDVFMENFTPRVMRRWGLDYPNLKKLKPDIIMVSNTGYGHGEGPWSAYPAQATTQEATHGHCHITGYRNDIPSKAGGSFVDFLSTWSALLTIAAALRHRQKTGKGQWIDIGMYQSGAYLTSEYILDYIANGRLGERMGNRHPWRVQGCYPCAGNDQWCVISIGDDQEWAALCQEMGCPEL
ncbi:MAG: CoA transferase, partial [Chloroflexi bacterium]|nr:CoA transferase [Chloroflexota bacterium]